MQPEIVSVPTLSWSTQGLRDVAALWPGEAVHCSLLYGEYDLNVRVSLADGGRRLLKISGRADAATRSLIGMQVDVLRHLRGKTAEFSCPVPVAANDGQYVVEVRDGKGGLHWAWMLEWLPGPVLDTLEVYSDALLTSIGRAMGVIDRALADYDHPGAHRPLSWNMVKVPELRPWLDFVAEASDRGLLEQAFRQLDEQFLPVLAQRPCSVIHNDGGNQHNMLLAGQDRISAVLDFGDMVYCPRICELGVAAAYASFGCADLVHAIGLAARGYHAVLPLAAEEIRILPGLVVARYLLSVLHAAKRAREDPGNAYAQVSAGQAWNGLRCILSLDLRQVAEQIEVQLARP